MYKIRATKQDAQKLLSDVPEERAFWCCDGRIFKNMRDLADGLENMSDETFEYHSNGEKHDFSNWLNDVVEDEKLGRDLSTASTRIKAVKRVNDRIALLSMKL